MPKTYRLDDIRAAVHSVKTAKLSVSQAAREFGVPRMTVSDHVRHEMKFKPGPDKMLTDDEEAALVNYCTYMASHGFPLSRQMARCYVIEIVKASGRPTLFNVEKGPSDEWFRKFVSRHPELSEKKPERQDRSRNRMSNSNVINGFFDFYEAEVKKLGNVPAEAMFNCDETGWSGKEGSRQKIFGFKGKQTYQQRVVTTDHVTAHLCVSAAGKFLPTMIIYQGSLPHRDYKDGIPGNWLFSTSESGYMDKDLFASWFQRIFVPNCGRTRPVVLVMDNHVSHISIPVIELARKESITLIGLPAHTTHLIQPLDVGVIGPLKDKFATVATNLGFVNKSLVIGKAKLPVVLNYAIDQITPHTIKEAFRKAGLYPSNRAAIDSRQLVPVSFQAKTAATTSDNENPEDQTVTCDKCGSYLGGNPLVKQGLIPESLAQIMLPPPGKVVRKRRKMVTEGRVISGDDMLEQLKLKEEEERIKEERASERKKEREEKRKIKEEKEKTKADKTKMKKRKHLALQHFRVTNGPFSLLTPCIPVVSARREL